ncbi:hypothetical protein F5148DRAFT_640665 [Russula earlei]|uniref:Uncharacterized protein n=1 Tax=Russula earlei TaxID=71964 RepID=A0ACC0UEG9_9AGAM|nr:hypothetical protein F5148DRAFT_640665 [Russula earlei]
MDSQQIIQSHLLIDGYIAHMFGPQDAEAYHASLLRTEPRLIQWHASGSEFLGHFFAAPPAGLESHQQDWVIDLATKDTGLVIPQQIWAPRKPSDAQRYVYHEQLRPPIFFIHKDGESLGIPVTEAAAGNCMHLRGADQAAAVGPTNHTQIRINWCGYRYLEWSDQIMIQRQTKETISLEKFAKYVAGKVLKFMEVAKSSAHVNDQRWLIGDNHITPRNVILIGVIQVSQGSWMPILQLNNGFALCLGM